jgi:cytochrome bd-type quinol oxidase subunit 2
MGPTALASFWACVLAAQLLAIAITFDYSMLAQSDLQSRRWALVFRFLFYGGVVILPVIAVYTIGVYWVFRGKGRKGYGRGGGGSGT